jgi:AraC family transcriptional regulator
VTKAEKRVDDVSLNAITGGRDVAPGDNSVVAFAPPATVRCRRSATWSAVEIETTEVLRLEPFAYEFTAPRHLLIASATDRYDGETCVDGVPKSHLRAWNRKMTFVPAGCRFSGWQKPRALCRGAHFYIDPCSPLLQTDLRFAEIQFRPRLLFFDGGLWATAMKLTAQSASSDRKRTAYAEALSIALACELMRVNESGLPSVTRIRGGLPEWQQKKLMQYIDEHLAEDVSLSSLAELVDLSPYHFSRVFKQSFDTPPHRYLTNRRIERAKNLLASRKLTVTVIALNVGFSETSSFTSAFRKVTGETPTDYRRRTAPN